MALKDSVNISEFIDNLLKTDHRPASYYPDMVMCGSTGNRVFGCFKMQPGLCGLFHFVHHSNIHDLLELDFQNIVYPVKLKTTYEWMPSHLAMKHVYPCFDIEEQKYITEGDIVVSRISIRSNSGRIKFSLGLKSKLLDENFEGSLELFNEKVRLKAFCSDPLLFSLKDIVMDEGENFEFTIACGFKVEPEKWPEDIPDLKSHKKKFGRFFEGIPVFSCSDKDTEKIYYYHWFLLRHHVSRPGLGNIQYPIVFEGRHGYFQNGEGGECTEWEFSRGILLSAQLHLLDLRWQRDTELLKGIILNFTENFGKMQEFLGYRYEVPLLPGCIRIHDFTGHYFFHMLPYIAWQIYELTKDRNWLEKVSPALWEDLLGWGFYDNDKSGLPLMVYEGDGAGEFGPASHYRKKGGITELPEVSGDLEIGLPCSFESPKAKWGSPIPNKRTEIATFYGLNYFAFYKINEILGDTRAALECFEKYAQIKHSFQKYMWDEGEAFFLELLSDNEKISEVKQVGGIYALLLLDPPNPEKYLENLSSPHKFNQEYGIASTSRDSFAYSPNNTVNGARPHTCLWNGPTWPFATSLSLLAIGRYIKNIEDEGLKKKYLSYFRQQLDKYTHLHYFYGDINRPCLIEHYNCETGLPMSEQDDYNHSCYIDIIVRMLCGIEVDETGNLNFSPLDLGIEYIRLEKIPFQGEEFTVEIHHSKAQLWREDKLIKSLDLQIDDPRENLI